MASSSRNASTIGPQLPPGFKRSELDDSDESDELMGPALPISMCRSTETENTGKVIGPVLPVSDETHESDLIRPTMPENSGCRLLPKVTPIFNENYDVVGPALPPHMRKDYIGPSLPPHMVSKQKCGPALPSRTVIGPVIPGVGLSDSDDDDEDSIGPKLFEAADAETQSKCTASADFERRAENMKNKLLSKGSNVNVREEWMTELPSRMVPQLGLGARSFKKQAYTGKDDDDRSEWTDTPADRKRKAEMENVQDQGPSVADIMLHRRNQEISKNLHHYNKSKRSESLMEIHQKKRKQKKNEQVKQERREFDRDKDLNIQNVDAKQARSFIDKAKLIGGKFSHGASHFL